MSTGKPLSPDTAWRVENLIRRKANELPPMATVTLSGLQPSNVSGFSKLYATLSSEGNVSRPIEFLLSDDGNTLEQVTTFDISASPRTGIPYTHRPSRGGAENAPVIIVGFDDLECPYCARLHASIFPAITNRYGNKIHVVYHDYPLEIHPWAMRAAVDVNCLAPQSDTAYWSAVDRVHAEASTIGMDPKDAKAERTMARASDQLDAITREEGHKAKLDANKIDDCIHKQDQTNINDEVHLAQSLSLGSTPVLFINGNKVEGALPIEYIFSVIDKALVAQGVTPPAPYVPPTPPAAAPKS